MSWAYWKQILVAFDQLINAVFRGYADESMSSRSWRAYRDGKRRWTKVLIDRLLWFDKNHCEKSYMSEMERAQCPPEMREKLNQ